MAKPSSSDSFTTSFIRHHINTNIRLIIITTALLLILLNLLTFRHQIPLPSGILHWTDANRPVIQIALINAHHANDEVNTALYDAFSHSIRVQITRYQQGAAYGMDDIVAQLPHPPKTKWLPMSEFSKLVSEGTAPDIVVSTTCANDYSTEASNSASALMADYEVLLRQHNTHLICVMHQSNHFIDGWGFELKTVFKPWILQERLDVVTLSPHVEEYFVGKVWPMFWEEEMGSLKQAGLRMRGFVPVFPVVANPKESGRKEELEGGRKRLRFAIQGSFDHGRDFESIFTRFVDVKNDWFGLGKGEDAEQIELNIIGSGTRPEVPEDIAHQIFFHENLDYTQYYNLLSEMDGLLPAFAMENWAGNDYYSNIASSSISASVIAGVPLVADFKLLKAYSYLRLSIVWYRDDEEHEIDAAFRMLEAGAERRRAMKDAVAKRRAVILQQNYANVEEWARQAYEKAQARVGVPVELMEELIEVKEVHKFNPFPTRPISRLLEGRI